MINRTRIAMTTPRSTTALILSLLVVALLMAVLTVMVFGMVEGGDMGRYIDRGDNLWSYFLRDTSDLPTFDPWDVQYMFPNLLVSAIVRITPGYADIVLIALNIVVYGVLIAFMMRTWLLYDGIQHNLMSVAVAIFLFFGMPGEVTKYLGYHHSSDIIFLGISGLALICLTMSFLLDKRALKAAALVIACLALITRPAGVATASLVLFMVAFSVFLCRYRLLRVAAFAVPVFVAIVLWPYYVQQAIETGSVISEGMHYILLNYQDGAVVSGYEPSYVASPKGYLDYVYITVLRCIYYPVPFRTGYSIEHFAANLSYITVGGLLLFRGCLALRGLGNPGKLVLLSLALYVVWMTLLHAMTQVEDWRYQLPIWPALWLIAGYGLVRNSTDRSASYAYRP